MAEVFLALRRSLTTLGRGRVWLYMLGPAIIALILFLVGRGQLKNVEGAPQTVETLKEIPETLKRNEENR